MLVGGLVGPSNESGVALCWTPRRSLEQDRAATSLERLQDMTGRMMQMACIMQVSCSTTGTKQVKY
eukprot:scaffold23825_cov259-Cylindrotheca_fusiformis.AAC.1